MTVQVIFQNPDEDPQDFIDRAMNQIVEEVASNFSDEQPPTGRLERSAGYKRPAAEEVQRNSEEGRLALIHKVEQFCRLTEKYPDHKYQNPEVSLEELDSYIASVDDPMPTALLVANYMRANRTWEEVETETHAAVKPPRIYPMVQYMRHCGVIPPHRDPTIHYRVNDDKTIDAFEANTSSEFYTQILDRIYYADTAKTDGETISKNTIKEKLSNTIKNIRESIWTSIYGRNQE